jgi:hypothetical protein
VSESLRGPARFRSNESRDQTISIDFVQVIVCLEHGYIVWARYRAQDNHAKECRKLTYGKIPDLPLICLRAPIPAKSNVSPPARKTKLSWARARPVQGRYFSLSGDDRPRARNSDTIGWNCRPASGRGSWPHMNPRMATGCSP